MKQKRENIVLKLYLVLINILGTKVFHTKDDRMRGHCSQSYMRIIKERGIYFPYSLEKSK